MSASDSKKRKAPAVYALTRASRCYNCDTKLEPGSLAKLQRHEDESEVLCMKCAGLDKFEVLAGGNAKATRLGAKYSPAHYVILKWSDLWKCYERQGLLLEPGALARVRAEI